MYDKSASGQSASALKAKKAIFEKTLALGGTLSGEHGIGLTKADYVGMQLGRSELNLMAGIKTVFDPYNIMNPGKGV